MRFIPVASWESLPSGVPQESYLLFIECGGRDGKGHKQVIKMLRSGDQNMRSLAERLPLPAG